MKFFEYGVASTQGARTYQEDAAAFWPASPDLAVLPNEGAIAEQGYCFAVLADGMGGHAGGSLASRTVCDQFLLTVRCHCESPREALQVALASANAAIAAKVAENPLLSGMGSTLVGIAVSQQGLDWISVGDSPLYLYRRGELRMLNEDHSLAPELDRLVQAGKLTGAEAMRDPRRHMLRSAVTGELIDMVDFSERSFDLEPGDCIVLASDGVETLSDAEIAAILSGSMSSSCEEIAKQLIRAVDARRAPHQDNATVLVARPLHTIAPPERLAQDETS